MTYSDSINYIHSLTRFGIRPGLERISALLNGLQNPEQTLKFVHVAGTNGKGSTCTMLASGLAEAGYRVGLYTSPYVLCFRERMQLLTREGGAQMISERDLAAVCDLVMPVAETLAGVTEFEFVTACAMCWFAQADVDIVVLEVGLGGRFDATNVITAPLVSVITTIGLDHTDILGDTVANIAAEKCGIIKKECPVVTTYLQPTDALDVIFAACEQQNAPLTMPDERQLKIVGESLHGTDILYFGKPVHVPFASAPMIANCLTALTAMFVLRDVGGMNINNDAFLRGVEKAFIPARQEVLRDNPLLLLDGSHNPDGIRSLAATVKRFIPEKKLLVLGMLHDKDYLSCIDTLVPLFDEVITLTPDSPRALTNEQLCAVICERYPSIPVRALSIEDAANEAKASDAPCVVCGSLYLASAIRDRLLPATKAMPNIE